MNYQFKLSIHEESGQEVYYNSYATQEEMLGDLHNAEKAIQAFEEKQADYGADNGEPENK